MLNYLVIADEALRDQDDGLSLVKIFNKLKTSELPSKLPEFTIAFSFSPEAQHIKNDKVKFEFTIYSIDEETSEKKPLYGVEGSAIRDGQPPKYREDPISGEIRIPEEITIDSEGPYSVELRIGEDVIGRAFFEVSLIKGQKNSKKEVQR